MGISGNISYNQNFISKYSAPNNGFSTFGSIILDYPQASVISGYNTGIDPFTGYYTFKLRPDVSIQQSRDWRYYKNYLSILEQLMRLGREVFQRMFLIKTSR